jgi:hypothetical protein
MTKTKEEKEEEVDNHDDIDILLEGLQKTGLQNKKKKKGRGHKDPEILTDRLTNQMQKLSFPVRCALCKEKTNKPHKLMDGTIFCRNGCFRRVITYKERVREVVRTKKMADIILSF